MNPLFEVVLEASLRISVLALAVWLALRLCRIRAGSVRHAAWLAVLAAMPLMPLLPRLVPEQVAVPVAVQLPEPPPTPPTGIPAAIPKALPALPPTPPPAEPIWPRVIWSLYGAVAASLFLRMLAGWRAAARVLRQSQPVAAQGMLVYESPDVAGPVTIGLRRPKILLPEDWAEWPDAKLRAVLAHELAHVARRDTLVSVLARLNRCLFWFHPLAWWLERELAMAAEQACDDAGVSAIGESRQYAQVLVEIAEAVHRRGRLLSFEGVGVDGTGLLGQRIDRILRGASALTTTRRRKAALALAFAVAVFLAVACRRSSIYQGELKPDPAYTKQLADHQEQSDYFDLAVSMSPAQAQELEAELRRNPEALLARRQLIVFYQARQTLEALVSFRSHKLWFIEHHPEEGACSLDYLRPDEEGDTQARTLWLAALERKDLPSSALENAARFFIRREPERAEKILLRAQAADPGVRWSGLLGRIYATVLGGPASRSPFGLAVRKTMQNTTDATLLGVTGRLLSGAGHLRPPDARALSRSYLQRSVEGGLSGPWNEAVYATIREASKYGRDWELVRSTPKPDYAYPDVLRLPESQRYSELSRLALSAYRSGEMAAYSKSDAAGVQKQWEQARRLAQEALATANHFPTAVDYRLSAYRANMTLGMVAIRVDGDDRKAARYLLAASKTPVPGYDLRWKLPLLLLRYGGANGREAVVQYLEAMHQKIGRWDSEYRRSAQQIRTGIMPQWYQSAITSKR